MKTWITTIGFEKYGSSNTIWLANKIDKFTPEKILFLYNDSKEVLASKETNMSQIKLILPGSQIEEIKFIDTIEDYKKVLGALIEKNKSDELAIDITGGRKYMSIIGTDLGFKNKIKRIYYVHYKSSIYSDKPVEQIPIVKLKLVNFALK